MGALPGDAGKSGFYIIKKQKISFYHAKFTTFLRPSAPPICFITFVTLDNLFTQTQWCGFTKFLYRGIQRTETHVVW